MKDETPCTVKKSPCKKIALLVYLKKRFFGTLLTRVLGWLYQFNLPSLQVMSIQKLLEHLPDKGCKNCILATPPTPIGMEKTCVCEDLFLRPLPTLTWRPTHRTWYARARCGERWMKEVTAKASVKAGLAKAYTNSCFRPSTITQLSAAGFSNRVTAQITGQKGHVMVEQYKRQAEMMTPEEWREAGMLMAPSGRTALRGGLNQWGALDNRAGTRDIVATNYRRVVQEKGGLSSIQDQVGLI